MRDTPQVRDPLAGAELRQAARFAMTLVTEQARVRQGLIRIVELGFPELGAGELFDDRLGSRLPLDEKAVRELSDQFRPEWSRHG